MKIELQEKLFAKYPKIFADKDKSPKETLICFGIETGDGWYWLIDNLCNTIQSYIDFNQHNKISQIKAIQIKEKYGTLRFYVNFSDNLIDGMIWFTEHLSGTICETCGTTKNVGRTSGWVITLCKKCYNKSSYTNEWKLLK